MRARELNFWEKVHLPPSVTCNVSQVMCHMSNVMCPVWHVTCHQPFKKKNNIHFFFYLVLKLVGGGSVNNGASFLRQVHKKRPKFCPHFMPICRTTSLQPFPPLDLSDEVLGPSPPPLAVAPPARGSPAWLQGGDGQAAGGGVMEVWTNRSARLDCISQYRIEEGLIRRRWIYAGLFPAAFSSLS